MHRHVVLREEPEADRDHVAAEVETFGGQRVNDGNATCFVVAHPVEEGRIRRPDAVQHVQADGQVRNGDDREASLDGVRSGPERDRPRRGHSVHEESIVRAADGHELERFGGCAVERELHHDQRVRCERRCADLAGFDHDLEARVAALDVVRARRHGVEQSDGSRAQRTVVVELQRTGHTIDRMQDDVERVEGRGGRQVVVADRQLQLRRAERQRENGIVERGDRHAVQFPVVADQGLARLMRVRLRTSELDVLGPRAVVVDQEDHVLVGHRVQEAPARVRAAGAADDDRDLAEVGFEVQAPHRIGVLGRVERQRRQDRTLRGNDLGHHVAEGRHAAGVIAQVQRVVAGDAVVRQLTQTNRVDRAVQQTVVGDGDHLHRW